MLKRILLAVVILSFCSSSGFAQDVFVAFGDGTDQTTGGSLGGNEQVVGTATGDVGTTGTAYLYVDGNFSFDGFQVDLVSTDISVATITSGFVLNSFNGAAGTRFNDATDDVNSNGTQDPGEGDINIIEASTADDITTFQAVSINQNGIITGNFAPFDTGFVTTDNAPDSATAGVFQLGSFQYNVVGAGVTDFQLQTTSSDVFAGPTGFLTIPEGESLSPVFGAATLTGVGGVVDPPAIPEPSALGVLALGLVGFVSRRRRS